MTVFAALRQAATDRPHAPALRYANEELTFAELVGRAASCATTLRAKGLVKGDRLAIDAPCAFDNLLWFLAADSIGLAALITAPGWSREERAHIDRQLQAHAVITSPTPNETGTQPITIGPDEDALFYIGATSGSSARPKLFTRSRCSWQRSFAPFTKAISATEADVMLVAGSLSSSTFLFSAMHAWHCGMTVVLQDSWSITAVLPQCTMSTILHVVPAMLADLAGALTANESIRARCSLRTILCCGAKLPTPLEQRVRQLLPDCQLIEYYGSSEHSLVSIRDGGDPTTVGFPPPDVDVYVSDEDGKRVHDETEGIIWVRSPFLFSGYLNEGVLEPSETLHNGWSSNGDTGVIREDGSIELRARQGQPVINTGGHSVSAAEVEMVLVQAPGVADVVVTGTHHDRLGSIVTAVIQPLPGSEPRLSELRSFTAERLSAAKRPRRWLSTPALPRTASAKIARAHVNNAIAENNGELKLEPLR